jgi:very-short-patch-repair endonuclease
MRVYNRRHQKSYRRHLRREGTLAEALLWAHLRGRQTMGCKFRRQHGIGPFIVDFYCRQARLVIELDGSIHESGLQSEYDEGRQRYIEKLGLRVLRFSNDAVLNHGDEVLALIRTALEDDARADDTTPTSSSTSR